MLVILSLVCSNHDFVIGSPEIPSVWMNQIHAHTGVYVTALHASVRQMVNQQRANRTALFPKTRGIDASKIMKMYHGAPFRCSQGGHEVHGKVMGTKIHCDLLNHHGRKQSPMCMCITCYPRKPIGVGLVEPLAIETRIPLTGPCQFVCQSNGPFEKMLAR